MLDMTPRLSATLPLPPGPPRSVIARPIIRFGRDPLARFTNLTRDYGDCVMFRAMGERVILLNHPDLIREVLVTQSKRFAKGRALERARSVLGTGLLTSEGSFHLRQRRLMQPAFHHERIAAFAGIMTAHAARLTAGWQDGATLDVAAEMMRLTLGIVGETLLGADVDADAAHVRDSFNAVMRAFPLLMMPFSGLLQKLPLPAMRRLQPRAPISTRSSTSSSTPVARTPPIMATCSRCSWPRRIRRVPTRLRA